MAEFAFTAQYTLFGCTGSTQITFSARCAVAGRLACHNAARGATEPLHGARWSAPYPPVAQRKGASFSSLRYVTVKSVLEQG